MVSHHPLHVLLGHERLHRTRQREPEDQRPQRLPEHEEAFLQALHDVAARDRGEQAHDLTSRAIASDASASLASASSPPAATASATQWLRWSSSSSSATACSALVTAEICVSTSTQ